MSDLGNIIAGMARGMAQMASMPKVYPFYLAHRITKALRAHDPENIIQRVGEMKTTGDCRYEIPVTDHNGTTYKITVEIGRYCADHGPKKDARCPWCASPPSLPTISRGGALFSVSCSNEDCPAHVVVEDLSPEKAMARWNERRL